LLAYLANCTAAGVNAGHDFNYTEKQKVVINTTGMWFGLEIAVGPANLPTLGENGKTGTIHYGRLYFR